MTGPAWVSATEIARGAGVKPAAVSNWRRRHVGFPAAEQRDGREVFQAAEVASWLDGRAVAAPDRRADEAPGATYGDRFRLAVDVPEPEPGPPKSADVPTGTGGRLWWALADAYRGRLLVSDGQLPLTGLAFALLHLRFQEEQRWKDLRAAAGRGLPHEVRELVWHAQAAGDGPDLSPLLESSSDVHRLTPAIEILERLEPVSGNSRGSIPTQAGPIADELLAHATTAGGRRSGLLTTPRSVVRMAVRLTNPGGGERIHDPFCRAGEFLTAAADHVRSRNPNTSGLIASGHAGDSSIAGIARMNLLLHDLAPQNLRAGRAGWPDQKPDEMFDLVLVNPPFNVSHWQDTAFLNFHWPYGEPPNHNANYAWLQFALTSLAKDGRAAVVMPAGAGSSANPRESFIRASMVRAGAVDAVVSLPPQLFPHTSIPVTLWILRRPDHDRDDVLFIDAHRAGTPVDRNRLELRDEDIDRIVAAYQDRSVLSSGTVISHPVARRRISEDDYALSPGRYLSFASPSAALAPGDPAYARASIEDLRHDLRGLRRQAAEAQERAELQLGSVGDLLDAAATSWKRLPLGDVCDVLVGFSGAIRTDHNGPSGTAVVKPRNLVENRISPEMIDHVAPGLAEKLTRYRLRPGDIVCVRTGQLGRQALVTEEQSGWLIGTSCLRLRPDESVDPSYLLYYLALPQTHEWLLAHSTGSAVRLVTAATIRRLPLLLPVRGQQEQIGAAVSALDDLAALHDRIRRAGTGLRDALLPLVFRDPGRGDPIAAERSAADLQQLAAVDGVFAAGDEARGR
ncbi:type I restriction-modification system subunit M/S [Frankia sp. CcI49]|uniref:type I restriction-modification system subunit M/S n=1 Tax=Frankia sp. CcI49 TaxID=1745382 RepID=UPI001F51CDE4|nr:type I restriction-modification system subunit M/S [Frankia sp. CcI49]